MFFLGVVKTYVGEVTDSSNQARAFGLISLFGGGGAICKYSYRMSVYVPVCVCVCACACACACALTACVVLVRSCVRVLFISTFYNCINVFNELLIIRRANRQ